MATQGEKKSSELPLSMDELEVLARSLERDGILLPFEIPIIPHYDEETEKQLAEEMKEAIDRPGLHNPFALSEDERAYQKALITYAVRYQVSLRHANWRINTLETFARENMKRRGRGQPKKKKDGKPQKAQINNAIQVWQEKAKAKLNGEEPISHIEAARRCVQKSLGINDIDNCSAEKYDQYLKNSERLARDYGRYKSYAKSKGS